jgi:hypothetical protein
MSVAKSDRECTASAVIAALCPSKPAANLKAVRTALTHNPIQETFRAFFSLDPKELFFRVFVVILSGSDNPKFTPMHFRKKELQ